MVNLPRSATGAHLLACRAAIAFAPAEATALIALGSHLADDGNPVSSRPWIDRAVALSPGQSLLLEAAAAVELRTGDFAAASRSLRRVLAVDPQDATRHAALARAQHVLALGPAHRRAIERATALAPYSIEVCRVAASLLRASGRLAEARAAGRRAVSLAPGDPDALVEAARAEQALSFANAAAALVERALAISPAHAEYANLAVMIASYAATAPRLAVAVRRHAEIARKAEIRSPMLHDPQPERRLRVGYVSSDLHDHPVGHNLIGLVEAHDRDRVAAHFYAAVARPDALTDRFRTAASAWRDVTGLSDTVLCDLIEADRIDILVHVAARFSGNRPALAFRHAAPLQFAAYDLTSAGTDSVVTFSDRDLHPAGSPEYFAERVHHLPTLILYGSPRAIPCEPPPALRNGFITFGSANNPAKWSDQTLALWARILEGVPDARLWLKFHGRTGDAPTRSVLQQRLHAHGLPLDRVDFASGSLAKDEHLQALSAVDIALDPHPFGGATASFEALWMGIPVVTLAADRMVGRTSAMLLRHAGATELVAPTPAAYVETACRLATDVGRLREMRETLRPRLAGSPLMDDRSYAAAVEHAYRDAWTSACARHHRRQTSR